MQNTFFFIYNALLKCLFNKSKAVGFVISLPLRNGKKNLALKDFARRMLYNATHWFQLKLEHQKLGCYANIYTEIDKDR